MNSGLNYASPLRCLVHYPPQSPSQRSRSFEQIAVASPGVNFFFNAQLELAAIPAG